MKKSCFLASVLATLLSNADPAFTDYTWKAVNGDYSGTFNDPAHWNNGQVPGVLARANFATANNYTLTLPYGNYDSYCNFKFFVGNNCVNVIDGRSSVFRMPGTEVDNYLSESFIFQGSGGHFFNLEAYEADAAVRFKYPHAELSNVMMTFTNDNNKVRAHFNEGIFKFNGVDGSVLTKLPRLTLFHCSGAEGSIHFHENSSLIAPNIELRGNVDNTLLSFDGGTHYIDGQLRIPSSNFVPSEKVTTFEVKDTADVKINSAQIGSSVGVKIDGVTVSVKSTNRVFNVVVKDGGTMSFYGDVNHSVGGTLNFDVLNGSYFYATNTTYFGRDKDCPNTIRIEDSYAQFKYLRSGYVTPTLLGVTNSTFDVTADWYVYNGQSEFVNSTINAGNILIGMTSGVPNANASVDLYSTEVNLSGGSNKVGDSGGEGFLTLHDGTVINVNRPFYLGSVAGGKGTMILEEGSRFNSVMTQETEKGIYIGDFGEGHIVMNGGELNFKSSNPSKYNAYCMILGSSANSSGSIEMNDGVMNIETDAALVVSANGDGEFLMKGGVLTTDQIRLGWGLNAEARGVFRQTGGTVNVTTKTHTKGVNVSDSTGRRCALILDGGIMNCHQVRGWTGASAKGGGGWAELHANGGTIKSINYTPGFIENFDEARLGEKGLTLDSDIHAVTISQDFTDAEGAEGEGRLILTGSSVKTLSSTNSLQSHLVLAGGKTLFTGRDGVSASHYSHVSITNFAILSFAGDHRGGRFKSLTLGDENTFGLIEMDADDVVYLDNELNVIQGTLLLSGGYENGNTYTLFVCDGEVSETSKKGWSNIFISTGNLDGFNYTFTTSYNEDENTTSYNVTITEDTPPANNIVWAGPGEDMNDPANWDLNTNPDSTYNVFFSNPDAPSSPTVSGDILFGTLVFSANKGFTLAGDYEINFGGSAFAKIKANDSVQTVATDIRVLQDIEMDVAKDAKLNIEGAVRYGGIRKTGGGALNLLSSRNALFNGVTLKEGKVFVPDPAMLGTSLKNENCRFLQQGGTFEIGNEDDAASYQWDGNFVVSTEVANASVIWKNNVDVTMKSPNVIKGCPVKRGKGRLTFTTSGTATISYGGFGTLSNDGHTDTDRAYEFDDENGTPLGLHEKYSDFMVVEGELVLRGTAPGGTAQFNLKSYCQIGLNTFDGEVQPGLVVDNAYLMARNQSRHFLLGSALNKDYTFVRSPYLYVTNNSYLEVDTLMIGRYSYTEGITNRVYVDNSTIYNSYTMWAMRSYGKDSLSILTFTNNAYCLTPSLQFQGYADLYFDNSVFANGSKNSPKLSYASVSANNGGSGTGAMYFKNNSKAYISNLDVQVNASPAFKLAFEGESEWIPSLSGDYRASFLKADRSEICTLSEKGLVLAPKANCEWTFAKAVTGEGGVLKKGEGTLKFITQESVTITEKDNSGNIVSAVTNKVAGGGYAITSPFTLDFDGVMDIREGKVVIEEGAGRTNAVFAGTGILSAEKLPSPVFNLSVNDDYETKEVLTLENFTTDGGATFNLSRDEENPLLRPFRPFVVARYTGNAPNLAGWKLSNTGLEQTSASFTAKDGVITAEISVGMLIIFK